MMLHLWPSHIMRAYADPMRPAPMMPTVLCCVSEQRPQKGTSGSKQMAMLEHAAHINAWHGMISYVML